MLSLDTRTAKVAAALHTSGSLKSGACSIEWSAGDAKPHGAEAPARGTAGRVRGATSGQGLMSPLRGVPAAMRTPM